MKKVFITGASGLIGSRLIELLPDNWIHLTPTIEELNILEVENLKGFIEDNNPDYIVHFAGLTNVNEAEKERGDKNGIVWRVNVLGTENLAKVARSSHIGLLHVSTDFVFPGSKDTPGPYSEDDPLPENMDGMSWYAWTKREAEVRVMQSYPESTIVRIMMPFRSKYSEKGDILRNVLDMYAKGTLYPMFDDQFITPTFIDESMKTFIKIISSRKRGIFHTACGGITTPFKFAEYVLEKSIKKQGILKRTSIHDYLKKQGVAPRPIFGGLKTEKTQKELGINFSSWEMAVDKVLDQIASYQ